MLNIRGTFWMIGLAYGGATILSIAAIAAIADRAQPFLLVWILILGAAILAVVALQAQSAFAELKRTSDRAAGDADLARMQMERQRAAVDNLAEGLSAAIFVCDLKGGIVFANPRAQELFRIADPVGRKVLAVTLSYDLEQLVLAAGSEQQMFQKDILFTYPSEKSGIAHAWPQVGAERVFLTIDETTDLRRLERIRQDFVANVSHELRTPLTIIRSMAETLQDEEDDPEQTKRYLGRIISEVDRLSLISNDLLILSAAESNPVRKQRCNLAESLRSTVDSLSGKANEKGLSITYEGPDELWIEANPVQIEQVEMNLIDNAINYTASGSITVSLRTMDSDAVFNVTDTGIGIASEFQDRIFERFYRVDKGRSRSSGGTGLGLSIVKHIVEAHGGWIVVKSELNLGSDFEIHLPIGDLSDHPVN